MGVKLPEAEQIKDCMVVKRCTRQDVFREGVGRRSDLDIDKWRFQEQKEVAKCQDDLRMLGVASTSHPHAKLRRQMGS